MSDYINSVNEETQSSGMSEIPYRVSKLRKKSGAPKPKERRLSLQSCVVDWIADLEEELLEESDPPKPYKMSVQSENPFGKRVHRKTRSLLVPPRLQRSVTTNAVLEDPLGEIACAKKVYSPEEIRRVRKDDESWVKTLNIVKTWKRYKIVDLLVDSDYNSRIWCNEAHQCQAQETDLSYFYKRKAKYILNKLCKSNFEKITHKLVQIAALREENIKIIALCLFNKVCTDCTNARLYSKFCLSFAQKVEYSRAIADKFHQYLFEIVALGFQNRMKGKKKWPISLRNRGMIFFISEMYNAGNISTDNLVFFIEGLLAFDFKIRKNIGVLVEDDLELCTLLLENTACKLANAKPQYIHAVCEFLSQVREKYELSKQSEYLIKSFLDFCTSG